MTKNKVSASQIKHISNLAQIPSTDQENEQLADAFVETLAVVDQLKTANTAGVKTTHQVTGFKNVFRPDQVQAEHEFSQEEALANAAHSYQGYFLVPQVLQNKDN